jgi:hypothetical protein
MIINNKKKNQEPNQYLAGSYEVLTQNNDLRKISMYDEPPQNIISLHEFS